MPPFCAQFPGQAAFCRRIKNPERIAESRKSPRVALWSYGKIEYVPADEADQELAELEA